MRGPPSLRAAPPPGPPAPRTHTAHAGAWPPCQSWPHVTCLRRTPARRAAGMLGVGQRRVLGVPRGQCASTHVQAHAPGCRSAPAPPPGAAAAHARPHLRPHTAPVPQTPRAGTPARRVHAHARSGVAHARPRPRHRAAAVAQPARQHGAAGSSRQQQLLCAAVGPCTRLWVPAHKGVQGVLVVTAQHVHHRPRMRIVFTACAGQQKQLRDRCAQAATGHGMLGRASLHQLTRSS